MTKSILLLLCICVSFSWEQLFEGDSCTIIESEYGHGQKGRCSLIENCPYALKQIKSGKHPKVCSFVRFTPIICCPNTSHQPEPYPYETTKKPQYKPPQIYPQTWKGPLTTTLEPTEIQVTELPPLIRTSSEASFTSEVVTGFPLVPPQGTPETVTNKIDETTRSEEIVRKTPQDIATEKCLEYSPEANDTKFYTAVFGGEDATPGEFPHMAILGFGEENSKNWLCGGSLISKSFVLTAAHCLFNREFGEPKFVRLGDLDIQNTTDDAEPQDFNVKTMISHPDFLPPSHYHDIALLELDREVIITKYVKPICLWTRTEIERGIATATGWGITEYLGAPSSHLMKARLAISDEERCKDQYKNSPLSRLANGIDYELQICAESSDLDQPRDTCEGDSGGPLQTQQGEYYHVIGITSFGQPCGVTSTAGVYVRVSRYIPWIVSNVWK